MPASVEFSPPAGLSNPGTGASGAAKRTSQRVPDGMIRMLRLGETPRCSFQRKWRFDVIPLLLILLILALAFGGFFVFSLKVAVVVALVLLVIGLFGGRSARGRRTAM
jgi:hypothetical protein